MPSGTQGHLITEHVTQTYTECIMKIVIMFKVTNVQHYWLIRGLVNRTNSTKCSFSFHLCIVMVHICIFIKLIINTSSCRPMHVNSHLNSPKTHQFSGIMQTHHYRLDLYIISRYTFLSLFNPYNADLLQTNLQSTIVSMCI